MSNNKWQHLDGKYKQTLIKNTESKSKKEYIERNCKQRNQKEPNVRAIFFLKYFRRWPIQKQITSLQLLEWKKFLKMFYIELWKCFQYSFCDLFTRLTLKILRAPLIDSVGISALIRFDIFINIMYQILICIQSLVECTKELRNRDSRGMCPCLVRTQAS